MQKSCKNDTDNFYDIIVIGGGMAGMSAAIRAKETYPDAKVLILEKNKKLGRKLYATGNGRCNLANTRLDLSCYHSANEFFPYEVVNTKSYLEVTDFFKGLGMEIYDDKGYLYPMSLQASTVVWALTDRLRALDVSIHTSETVTRLCHDENGYILYTDKSVYKGTLVIASPGSAAAPGLGGSEAVYSLLDGINLKQNIRFVAAHPALCKLRCTEDISELAGVRARAEVRLFSGTELCGAESGEVQFTDGFLSGIAVFNLSMEAIELLRESASDGVFIELEFAPQMTKEELLAYMGRFAGTNGGRKVYAMLGGIVNEKLASYILRRSGVRAVYAGELQESDMETLSAMLKKLSFQICGHAGYEDSQAASGGVDTRCIRPDTMELDGFPGLFVAGEYADVTGKCGGYNIMWAVVSGMRAGTAAGNRNIQNNF